MRVTGVPSVRVGDPRENSDALFLGGFRHFRCACLYLHSSSKFARHKQAANKQNGRLLAFCLQFQNGRLEDAQMKKS